MLFNIATELNKCLKLKSCSAVEIVITCYGYKNGLKPLFYIPFYSRVHLIVTEFVSLKFRPIAANQSLPTSVTKKYLNVAKMPAPFIKSVFSRANQNGPATPIPWIIFANAEA